MKRLLFLLFSFCLCIVAVYGANGKSFSNDAVKLIPVPTSYVKTSGKMKMTGQLRLVTNEKISQPLRQWLRLQWRRHSLP